MALVMVVRNYSNTYQHIQMIYKIYNFLIILSFKSIVFNNKKHNKIIIIKNKLKIKKKIKIISSLCLLIKNIKMIIMIKINL